jgi:hypothetical protein
VESCDIKIYLVVPFFNEERYLPKFFKKLRYNIFDLKNVGLIGVNHNSTDNSEKIFRNEGSRFGYLEIIKEPFLVKCVGVPRKTGLDRAYQLAQKAEDEVFIGSLDADAYVHRNFLRDAYKHLSGDNCKLYVFPSRHDQEQLRSLIKNLPKEVRDSAIRTILGVEWLKFQIREILYSMGVNETRASGGFFMKNNLYKMIGGHKQFFNTKGEPISGESNALGIKAKQLGVVAGVSRYLTEMDGRRFIKSIREVSDVQGYRKDKLESKVFSAFTEIYGTKKANIDVDQFDGYFEKAVGGLIKMLITRSFCYNSIGKLKRFEFLSQTKWREFLDYFAEYIKLNLKEEEDRYIIGAGIFSKGFNHAKKHLGTEEYLLIQEVFEKQIPSNDELLHWSKAKIYHPDLLLK